MAKTCKYQKYRKYVSFDNGQTWSPLDEYRDGELIEYDSPDCGGGTTEYRWVTVNQYCEDTDLYAHQKKQVSYDGGQTWEDTNPLVTQEVLIETGSTECQPVPPTPIPQYKWVVVNEYCDGLDLYEHQKQQVSYDSGTTWEDTNPLVTQEVLIEEGSAECEPTPPPPTTYKVVKHYGTGNTSSIQCNSESALTQSEVYSGGSYAAITSAEIGTCVQAIGDNAFSACTAMTSVTIPDSVTSIGSRAFSGCSSLTSITIPDSVTSIGTSVFSRCSAMTTCTIGNGVTSIGSSTFRDCSGLSSITIPSGVTTIGATTFAGCSSLSSITIPDSVTSIGTYAFDGCSSLSSITIPDSVTSIDGGAFQYCSVMTTCYIGSGVTSIGDSAFASCSSLSSITITATTPPTLGSYAFSNIGNFSIIVPCESLNAYKTANGWSEYASRITCQATPQYRWITANTYCNGTDLYAHKVEQVSTDGGSTWTDTGVTDEELIEAGSAECQTPPTPPTGIKLVKHYGTGNTHSVECNADSALTYSEVSSGGSISAITSAEIGDCVQAIGYSAFYGCSSLTSVTIPSGVTSIGQGAFGTCSGLTSITIPDSVTSIDASAFINCTSLSSVTIPSGVTSIGDATFQSCTSLTSITIPSGVTNIGQGAFYNCSSLTSVTVNATTPPTLGFMAFDNTNNCNIYVPASSLNTYKSASGWSDYASRIQAIQ